MGNEGYRQIIQKEGGRILPRSHPLTVSVNRVLARLIPHARIDGADWKVHVIRDDRMENAFVLPGYVSCHFLEGVYLRMSCADEK